MVQKLCVCLSVWVFFSLFFVVCLQPDACLHNWSSVCMCFAVLNFFLLLLSKPSIQTLCEYCIELPAHAIVKSINPRVILFLHKIIQCILENNMVFKHWSQSFFDQTLNWQHLLYQVMTGIWWFYFPNRLCSATASWMNSDSHATHTPMNLETGGTEKSNPADRYERKHSLRKK